MASSKDMNAQITKGTAIAGSSTGVALLIAWIYRLKYNIEMPPDVAIVIAGVLSFTAGRIWSIVDQILEKKYDIDLDGE